MATQPFDFATHEVANQPPPLEAYNLFAQDAVLRAALAREGGAWGEARLARFGAWLGEAATLRLGEQANRQPPLLRSHDRFGHRIDEVEFAPAWHELLGRGGRRAGPRAALGRPAARRARGPRRGGLSAEPGRERRLLPARDDLRRAPRAARRAADRQGLGREDPVRRVRPGRRGRSPPSTAP